MYLPRNHISQLYLHLLRTHHPLSPPVLILAALEPDTLCACRILTALLKRDYIPHKIQPIAGYGDLTRAGSELVRPMQTSNGGSGGVVVCMGVGGLVDLAEMFRLDNTEGPSDMGGVQVWVFDARRPWNLGNVFGGHGFRTPLGDSGDGESAAVRSKAAGLDRGRLSDAFKPGNLGGVIVYDDGDIDEGLTREREAYCELEGMPEVDDDGNESDASDGDSENEGESAARSKKRKSWSGDDDGDNTFDDEDGPPRQRRRSNSVCHCPKLTSFDTR